MFASIISRDGGCPWGETGMTSAKWLDVPTELVTIRDLVATQPGILLHALSEDYEAPPIGGDPLPHVVAWRGRSYLEDGHHRVVRAALRGASEVEARVLEIPDGGGNQKVHA